MVGTLGYGIVWGLDDKLGYTVRFSYVLLEREGNSTTKEAFQIL